MVMARSIAKACLRFTGLFEAELLLELLLRQWKHPRADDADFRSGLLEAASEILRASIAGDRLVDSLKPRNMNFIAAIWYAESVSIQSPSDVPPDEINARQQWLNAIARSLPSCFCDPNLLP
jgi:hypothetical protein